MTAATIAPGPPSDMEERRNQQRDKAQILLKLAEAVEDSSQRRRKASAAASVATADDLTLLARDLQSQVSTLSPNKIKVKPPSEAATAESIQSTVQNVVTAVYHLREHAHLHYQILEMRYFDLKRHAYDMENRNRKLQLQLSTANGGAISTAPDDNMDVGELLQAQQEELTAQLQQENEDLRRQLRESCADCRKLVQENYGLRKLLLNAGVLWNRSAESSSVVESKAETVHESESDGELVDEFQDAQEFNVVPEEKGDVSAEDPRSMHSHNNCNVQDKAYTIDAAKTKEEANITDDDSTESQYDSGKEEDDHRPPQLNESLVSSNTEFSFHSTVPAVTPPSQGALPARSQMNDSTGRVNNAMGDSCASIGTDVFTPGRRRSSVKSVTFAAMASKLANSKGSSNPTFAAMAGRLHARSSSNNSSCSGTSIQHDNDDYGSVSTINTTTTEQGSRWEQKDAQQHDNNLRLLGAGGIFSASTQSGTLQHRRSSGKGEFSGRSISTKKPSSSFQPTNQAMTAKDLMRQQKMGKKVMTAKDLMRKQGKRNQNESDGNSSGTFHIRMSSVTPPRSALQASKRLDPLEEEQRLSALLGGYRPGPNNSSPSSLTRRNSSDDASSVASAGVKKSFFRRRKSHKDNDDDSSVASSKSLGFLFRRPSIDKRRLKHPDLS